MAKPAPQSATLTLTYEDGSVTFYPITKAESVVDLQEKVEEYGHQGQWAEAEQKAIQAKNIMAEMASILFLPVPVPTLETSEFEYTGELITPEWPNVDSVYVETSGSLTGLDAGTYTTVFKLKNIHYTWEDGTKETKTVTWNITKAPGKLTLTENSVALDVHKLRERIGVTRLGNGTISAVSADPTVCDVTIDGNDVIVVGVDIGSTEVTIAVSESNNCYATHTTIPVNVNYLTTLAETPPDRIKAATSNGTAKSLWAVGDRVGIHLEGTVEGVPLTGTYYAFIMGFDHNSVLEGDRTIHFQLGKTADGTDIAFKSFAMNSGTTNTGGWELSHIRSKMQDILECFPEEWQAIMVDVAKYTDNIGSANPKQSNVTKTMDKLWLLSAYEINGANSLANSYERSYQSQYEYYLNGNSKVKKAHLDVAESLSYWTRSAVETVSTGFCYVTEAGLLDGSAPDAAAKRGIMPCFVIA